MALLPVVAAEAIALFVVLFKTYPVMQSKLQSLEKNQGDDQDDFNDLKKVVESHRVQLAEEKKERESIKRDLDDTRQSMKEINLELRKAVEENTKAIIALETTLKFIATTLKTP